LYKPPSVHMISVVSAGGGAQRIVTIDNRTLRHIVEIGRLDLYSLVRTILEEQKL